MGMHKGGIMKAFSSLVFILFASVLSAQTVTVGLDLPSFNASDNNTGPIRTDISLDNPATGNGTISTVKFGYSASCTAAVKIKFFRRSGNTFTMTAERGPFNTTTNNNTVTLSPGVAVQTGDLIAIAKVAQCGNPVGAFGTAGAYVGFPSDVTTSVNLSAGSSATYPLALFGTGAATPETTAAILPVVGSVAGGFGSNFKTSVQLFNGVAGSPLLTGRFVFHRAGTPGTASDPSVPFAIGPGTVGFFADVVAAMGQSGIGSMDVMVPAGQSVPVIVTRIFNDGGAAGTAGLIEEPVNPATIGLDSHVLTTGTTGFLVTPLDPTKTRFNIGVRSLSAGAQINVVLRGSNADILRTVTKTYGADFFEQPDASTFLGGFTIGGNQSIQITVTSGSIIVYGSTTDNTTNDPAMQVAQVVVMP